MNRHLVYISWWVVHDKNITIQKPHRPSRSWLKNESTHWNFSILNREWFHVQLEDNWLKFDVTAKINSAAVEVVTPLAFFKIKNFYKSTNIIVIISDSTTFWLNSSRVSNILF